MRTLRLIGRGASDTFESLLPFAALSLAWWVCVALVVPAPAATVALAALTDPRRRVDRPGWRDAVAALGGNLRRGWAVALLTLPFVAVLLANLAAYAGGGSRWALLVPLWSILLVVALAVALGSFSSAGLFGGTAVGSVSIALHVVLRRPLGTVSIVIGICLLAAIGTTLVVPLVLLVPALVAAVTNRFVLDTLDVPVPDPLERTAERQAEDAGHRAASRRGA